MKTKVSASTNKSGAEVNPDKPKRRKDGRLTKAERTKKSILESAQIVFAEEGYDRTTLDDIGDRVNLLGTAILYHFKSKKHLYHETLRFSFKSISKKITADIDQSLSLEEMVVKIGIDLIRESVDRPESVKLFMREAAAGTPESLSIIGPMIGNALQYLIAALENPKRSSKSTVNFDPVLVTSMLLGVISFYFSGFPTIMGDKLPYDPLDPERVRKLENSIEIFVRLLMNTNKES
ncbi:TetR/AcrR family transcriptional regulator [Haliea sp. E1-2-M8]|uniref:TetR/AcrR family transcriptional regulator n=1 Tax=Haliea sp. E1-2-M8 TaxID=3064706 RepID=UPI0027242A81|nr:TetR/AcrR family transcriptional regulator [Haliea sp. E1-2-M8]MDO8863999.1 TetR/AcrR family transcriptional regulator [Haliea sp. E1-2-M8]